jgi:hypothetical protein
MGVGVRMKNPPVCVRKRYGALASAGGNVMFHTGTRTRTWAAPSGATELRSDKTAERLSAKNPLLRGRLSVARGHWRTCAIESWPIGGQKRFGSYEARMAHGL